MNFVSIGILFANICVLNIAIGQELNTEDFRSPTAKSAVSAYNRKVNDAQRDFDKVESRAREELIDKLESVQKSETAKNNLEDAVKLKETIEALKKDSAKEKKSEATPFLGMWKISVMSGHVRYQLISIRNNQLYAQRSNEPNGPITDEGPVVFVDGKPGFLHWNNPKIFERYTVDGDRLVIEQFNSKAGDSDLNRIPDNMGVAVRVPAN